MMRDLSSRERFFCTAERREVDRPAVWLGLPAEEALPGLFAYFDVSSVDELRRKLGDDIYPIELPYHSPTSNAIYAAFDFAKRNAEGRDVVKDRTLTAPGFFEDYDDPEDVRRFDWPEPEKYIDPEECRKIVGDAPEDKAVVGVIWSAHFQDVCAAFGMETALMNMITNPGIFAAVSEKIEDFYLRANRIFYEATAGRLDAVLIGNDLGSQTGLMLSPELIREYVLPGTKKFVDQAKSYGLKVIHHSCGAVFDIIPDLISLGIDVIHPIQALAANMEAERLKETFEGKVSFCGGVDAQELLVNGTPDEVFATVRRLKRLFPTGLIISPSHEAILPDIRPENVEALFNGSKE